MDWLLRCLTVYITGQPYYNPLAQCTTTDIQKALPGTAKAIGDCLDRISARLGLDHGKVLGGVFPIVTMIGYLRHKGKEKPDSKEWDRLLYWYVHAFLWGRYASSTESNLAQDLNIVNRGEGVEGLLRHIRQSRGDLKIRPEDFWGWSTGARFYPLLYLLTRTSHARDWGTNVELNDYLLGKNSSLNVHHIFPKNLLYEKNKSKSIVNALANYAFLTKETNLEISNRCPQEYIPVYKTRCPGAVETHWMPDNPELYKLDNYEKFLEERRILLANAANELLESLYSGNIAEASIITHSTKLNEAQSDEEEEIVEMSEWMENNGLYEGVQNHELLDQNGEVEAIVDLAWPQGIQSGLSEPVALLLNETAETQAIVSKHGYRYYTSITELKEYIL